MIEVQFKMSEFERAAQGIGASIDQIPFAISVAMNRAAQLTRETLISETWPGHVTVRNRNFIRRALRTKFATKRDLSVAIYDDLGRAHLKEHADAGVKRARGRLAIPQPGIRRTSRGVAASDRPKQLIAKTPKRALRITQKGIFVGVNGRLQLKYVFAGQAQIRKDVPFREDFARLMRQRTMEALPSAVERAMRTRR
jgi:hypothetical protein